jgi:hypothetical protein
MPEELVMKRIGVLVFFALLLTGCGGGGGSSPGPRSTAAPTGAPSASSAAQIWMQPKPFVAGQTGLLAGGSTDFTSLFAGTASWPTAAAHTAVFGLYAGWVADIDTPTLTTLVNFLTAQKIPIELEAPSLQATATCGTNVEGYVPYGQSITTFTNGYLQRLQALGANVAYIKVDEPYFFGSIAQSSPNSCAWPVSQVAQYVAQYVTLVHATYPSAQVGDVEPVITTGYGTDPVTAISGWHDAFTAAMGSPFPFYIADMDFSNTGWPALAVQMQQAMRARGEKFGIIFIGDPTDTSDAIWSSKTLSRVQMFASTSGSAPDFVFFQSWDTYPQYCLPESDPTTFTGVMKAYINANT